MSGLPVRPNGPPAGYEVFKPRPAVREDVDKRFYWRADWRNCRAAKLAKDPLCEVCKAAGVVRPNPADQVHHVIDRRERPDLAYELSNLQSLCQTHHSQETMRRNHRRGVVGAGSRNPPL